MVVDSKRRLRVQALGLRRVTAVELRSERRLASVWAAISSIPAANGSVVTIRDAVTVPVPNPRWSRHKAVRNFAKVRRVRVQTLEYNEVAVASVGQVASRRTAVAAIPAAHGVVEVESDVEGEHIADAIAPRLCGVFAAGSTITFNTRVSALVPHSSAGECVVHARGTTTVSAVPTARLGVVAVLGIVAVPVTNPLQVGNEAVLFQVQAFESVLSAGELRLGGSNAASDAAVAAVPPTRGCIEAARFRGVVTPAVAEIGRARDLAALRQVHSVGGAIIEAGVDESRAVESAGRNTRVFAAVTSVPATRFGVVAGVGVVTEPVAYPLGVEDLARAVRLLCVVGGVWVQALPHNTSGGRVVAAAAAARLASGRVGARGGAAIAAVPSAHGIVEELSEVGECHIAVTIAFL